MGFNDDYTIQIWDKNQANQYTLWHSGNFNPSQYLPKSDGIVSGKLSFENTNTYVVYNKTNKYIEVFNNTGMSGIAFGDDGTNKVYSNGWKTIIHKGNIGNQNVSYASRAGALVNSSNQAIAYLSSSGNIFYIGDSIYDATETHMLGKQVKLRGGSSATLGLTIDSDGDTFIEKKLNVKNYVNINRNGATGSIYNTSYLALEIQPYGSYVAFRAYKSGGKLEQNMLVFTDKSNLLVGTSVDNGYTFQVNGGIYTNANLCVATTGGGVLVGGLGNTIDGYSANTSSYSALHLNYTSSYDLSLCNGGGSVCIGNSQGDSTKKLDVKGHIALTGYLYMSDSTSTYRAAIDKTGNTILFGYGQSIANYDVQYLGYNIRLYAGGGHNTGKGIDILANGNVGIGTANPSSKLDVKGQIASYENLIYEENAKRRITIFGTSGIGRIYNYDESSSIYGDMYIGKNGAEAITIKGDTFNVGINNASPNYKLDVKGNIAASSSVNSVRLIPDSDCGIFMKSNGQWLHVVGSGSKMMIYNGEWDSSGKGNYNKGIVINTSNYVGIGTESPSYKLDVNGVIKTNSGSLSPYIRFISIGTGTYNVGSITTNSTYGLELEAAKATDSATGTALPIFIGWRGGALGIKITSGGNLLANGGITMYSDQRKKTILNNVELSLKQIANAPIIEHYYNSDENKTTHVSSIAQYWYGLNDWFCKEDSEGFLTMEIQNAALASAISIARELDRYETKTDKTIKQLRKRICQLEEEVKRLKSA